MAERSRAPTSDSQTDPARTGRSVRCKVFEFIVPIGPVSRLVNIDVALEAV